MPFCPKCHSEYEPMVSTCPDCQMPLVWALPPDPNQGELFEAVELCKVPDEIVGMALQSFLLEAGIEANLQDMGASFYGNVLSGIQGYWGKVLVSKEDEALARKRYAEFQREFQGR